MYVISNDRKLGLFMVYNTSWGGSFWCNRSLLKRATAVRVITQSLANAAPNKNPPRHQPYTPVISRSNQGIWELPRFSLCTSFMSSNRWFPNWFITLMTSNICQSIEHFKFPKSSSRFCEFPNYNDESFVTRLYLFIVPLLSDGTNRAKDLTNLNFVLNVRSSSDMYLDIKYWSCLPSSQVEILCLTCKKY